ncbi:chalcone isomerase family protein [uncultured Aquabacterium sp.]|jgi:hypothetical protein|uniref:chalcone isomerase family protein n=1 Tax=uncultured Aquabacterium sp. TaxID=158753 RepID=UPI002612B135|nr:chalcone isomerase family protein [uncultured Aquabacterium sp.]
MHETPSGTPGRSGLHRRTGLLRAAFASGLATAALTLPAAWAQPTELFGISYPQTLKVEGRTLQLNGAGVTYRAVAKLYTVALYTPEKSSQAEAVVNMSGPVQLRFVMLQGMRVDEIGKTITRGIELNSNREAFFNLIPAIRQMGEQFSHIKRLNAGDTFAIDHVPDRGTMFFVNGQPAGLPIADKRFFPAVLRVWLGSKPASPDLRDALLSYKAPAVLDALE